MRDIGFTKDGRRIVEMSNTEYALLSNLCLAVEGKSFSESFMQPSGHLAFQEGYDFSTAFEVIRAFYETKFRINELKRQIESMEDSLNK